MTQQEAIVVPIRSLIIFAKLAFLIRKCLSRKGRWPFSAKKYRLAKPHFAQNFFVMRLFSENCLAKFEFGGC
ncbi:MAG: hypothetical protein DMF00_17185 [Verrucomicrobia bacterium]|nr:MAG: hypothetical protein DMF00_17185 [Verrucomicrobiota bacterium]